jgi:hypothetical protein
MPYTTREIAKNHYLVVGSDGAGIKNHLDAPIPPLSTNLAEQQCADLNEISEKEEYKLNEMMEALTPAEKFMTDLLFNFLDRCSITFSLFCVVELIDDDTLLDLYFLFHHCVHPEKLDKNM